MWFVIYCLSQSETERRLRMESSHSSALLAKHAGLDARISAELARPSPDSVIVATLKKQKLKLKETISRL